eukprot:2816736-Amphidinium_carterae.1
MKQTPMLSTALACDHHPTRSFFHALNCPDSGPRCKTRISSIARLTADHFEPRAGSGAGPLQAAWTRDH